ncbi:unnamed protein product [Vicia faba]|uniref:PI-PLC Y-box domain-containing protein n=1 Tax=Vicia faba TaxID=3906 RepID=A0AAV0ZFT0_VICFA|nr:unnamed protein product [Vicia faba]
MSHPIALPASTPFHTSLPSHFFFCSALSFIRLLTPNFIGLLISSSSLSFDFDFDLVFVVSDYERILLICSIGGFRDGYGRSLWLMQGMFKTNGGYGFVKKPYFLLKIGPNNEIFDPKASLPLKTTLKETVYMREGWYYDFKHIEFDQFSPPAFYARVR